MSRSGEMGLRWCRFRGQKGDSGLLGAGERVTGIARQLNSLSGLPEHAPQTSAAPGTRRNPTRRIRCGDSRPRAVM
jgi:hypothetical protein